MTSNTVFATSQSAALWVISLNLSPPVITKGTTKKQTGEPIDQNGYINNLSHHFGSINDFVYRQLYLHTLPGQSTANGELKHTRSRVFSSLGCGIDFLSAGNINYNLQTKIRPFQLIWVVENALKTIADAFWLPSVAQNHLCLRRLERVSHYYSAC